MPHPCETKFNVKFVLFILWIFLNEKIEFCCDCVECNTPKYQVFLQSTPISKWGNVPPILTNYPKEKIKK